MAIRRRYPRQLPAYYPPAGPADSDSGTGTDGGHVLGSLDADSGHGEDSGFASVAAADAVTGTELGVISVTGADGSGAAADLELNSWPSDSDRGGTRLQPGLEYQGWSGPLSDPVPDAGRGTDSEPPFRFADAGAASGGYVMLAGTFSPLGLWLLNGDASDQAVVPHNGIASGVTFGQASASLYGTTSAAFDGVTSEVAVPYNPSGLSAVTAGGWVNLSGLSQVTGSRVISSSYTLGDNCGFDLFTIGTGGSTPLELAVAFGNGTAYGFAGAAGVLPATGWAHAAGTWDGTTVRLYLNGVLQASAPLSGTLAAGTGGGIGIGYLRWSGAAVGFLNGLAQGMLVLPVALTAPQLAALAAGSMSGAFTETCTGTEGHIIGVYSFQPPFRWTGGQYELRLPVRHAEDDVVRLLTLWRGERPDGTGLRLAAAHAAGRLRFVTGSDSCRAAEREEAGSLAVALHIAPALAVRLETGQALF